MKIIIKTPRKNKNWQLTITSSRRGGVHITRNRQRDIISAIKRKVSASSNQARKGLLLEVDYGYHTDVWGKRARFNNESHPTGVNELVKHARVFTDWALLEYFT